MIVCYDLKLCFVHIPHAAGTSITHFLKSESNDWEKVGDKHAPASEAPDDYYTFCVVRNHWDWILSTYSYTVKTEGYWDKTKWEFISKNNANVSEFVIWYTQTSEHSDQDVWNGQFFWTGKRCSDVDEWLKMENNEIEGFNRISNRFGISKDLPKKNSSSSKHRHDTFNDEAIEAVRNHYSDEIDYFNFNF